MSKMGRHALALQEARYRVCNVDDLTEETVRERRRRAVEAATIKRTGEPSDVPWSRIWANQRDRMRGDA